ncbi:MAG: hypothetical protein V1706_16800 [Pseudomonadota bacterium]
MENFIQRKFESLKEKLSDPMWADSENAWIKTLGPTKLGMIGKQLAVEILGGNKVKNSESGYDIESQKKCIQVKLATVSLANGYPLISWKQICPRDSFTHICFIGIYPNNVRMFLVPKKDIPTKALSNMHKRTKNSEIFQIHCRQVDELFPWMVQHEIIVGNRA